MPMVAVGATPGGRAGKSGRLANRADFRYKRA
jgi:hypothetical protein